MKNPIHSLLYIVILIGGDELVFLGDLARQFLLFSKAFFGLITAVVMPVSAILGDGGF
jgi:hypothetical protein